MSISKKVAIRFLSMIMALAMCFSLSATAFATDVTTAEGKTEVVLNEEVAPLAEYKQLAIIESGPGDGVDGSLNFYVTPDKGAKLCIKMGNQVNGSNDLTITVKKAGGGVVKTLTLNKGIAIKDYVLVSNCNGNVYTINVAGQPAILFGIVYQK